MSTEVQNNGTTYYITDGTADYPTAATTRYDHTESGLTANSVQAAIDELKNNIDVNKTGSGVANSRCFIEEITEITPEMWNDISTGAFKIVHVGMHYTAPSGRKYWFADANYFKYKFDTNITFFNHMLIVEDECQNTAQHHVDEITTGGAPDSLIYTDFLPAHQSELEEDFGADHIKNMRILMCSSVSTDGVPNGQHWYDKTSIIMNTVMVYGHTLGKLTGGEMYNIGNRASQLSLFRAIPETIISRLASTQERYWYWLDDVASATEFAHVYPAGFAGSNLARRFDGVRRAFIVG